MNGRVYDPKLGRMLSPDPVTQAPENGQNYNRYTYANNNPLKYTDPSGFYFEGAPTPTPTDAYLVVTSVINVLSSIFGGNNCDADCQWRHEATDWCSSSSSCQNARKEWRGKHDKYDYATGQTIGDIPYIEYTKFQAAQTGDQTSGGLPSVETAVVGAGGDEEVLIVAQQSEGVDDYPLTWQNFCLQANCIGKGVRTHACLINNDCLYEGQRDSTVYEAWRNATEGRNDAPTENNTPTDPASHESTDDDLLDPETESNIRSYRDRFIEERGRLLH